MGRLAPISKILFVTAPEARCGLRAAMRDPDTGDISAAWLELERELARPVETVPHGELDEETRREVVAPSILALADDGTLFRLMDATAIERCQGNVAHIRGRLLYRAGRLGLDIPGAINAAVVVGALRASRDEE